MGVIDTLKESSLKGFLAERPWWQKLLIFFAAMLLIVIFFNSLVMPLYTRQGQEFKLPDVTEKDLTEAVDILEDNGFIPVVQDSVFDDFYAKDVIVQQNPSPFSTVKKGRRVYLVISSGEKPIIMPDLITRTLTDAVYELQSYGLAVQDTFWRFSDSLYHRGRRFKTYRGIVIRQSIRSGTEVTNKSRVNLTVSLGPGRKLPNLTNETLKSALSLLRNMGISRDRITYKRKYEPSKLPNTVLSQSVRAGTPIGDVDTIELVVSVDRLPPSSQ